MALSVEVLIQERKDLILFVNSLIEKERPQDDSFEVSFIKKVHRKKICFYFLVNEDDYHFYEIKGTINKNTGKIKKFINRIAKDNNDLKLPSISFEVVNELDHNFYI